MSYGYRGRYAGDPHRITTRFAGKCAKCDVLLPKGAEGFYYPNGRKLYGMACGCGETAERDFAARAFDEDAAPQCW